MRPRSAPSTASVPRPGHEGTSAAGLRALRMHAQGRRQQVPKQIKTTVKTKKGKTQTVTKTITDYVVADFAWKDPIGHKKPACRSRIM